MAETKKTTTKSTAAKTTAAKSTTAKPTSKKLTASAPKVGGEITVNGNKKSFPRSFNILRSVS